MSFRSAKSQIIISAYVKGPTWKPMCVTCPEAIYLPHFDTVMQVIALVCPWRNSCESFLVVLPITTVEPRE